MKHTQSSHWCCSFVMDKSLSYSCLLNISMTDFLESNKVVHVGLPTNLEIIHYNGYFSNSFPKVHFIGRSKKFEEFHSGCGNIHQGGDVKVFLANNNFGEDGR